RPPVEERSAYPIEPPAATAADASRVLKLCCQQVPLIEVRRPLFGLEMLPTLRNRRAVQPHAGERACIVCRLRQRVLNHRRESVAQAPTQLDLTVVFVRVAVGGQVHESLRTGGTG